MSGSSNGLHAESLSPSTTTSIYTRRLRQQHSRPAVMGCSVLESNDNLAQDQYGWPSFSYASLTTFPAVATSPPLPTRPTPPNSAGVRTFAAAYLEDTMAQLLPTSRGARGLPPRSPPTGWSESQGRAGRLRARQRRHQHDAYRLADRIGVSAAHDRQQARSSFAEPRLGIACECRSGDRQDGKPDRRARACTTPCWTRSTTGSTRQRPSTPCSPIRTAR